MKFLIAIIIVTIMLLIAEIVGQEWSVLEAVILTYLLVISFKLDGLIEGIKC